MKFGNRDPEFIKKRIEAMKEKKDNPGAGNRDFIFTERVPNFQARDGENIIRILPATWEDAYFPWYEAHIHYQIGANNGQFLCAARMINKPCPICEEGQKLQERNEPEDSIKRCYPQQRAIAWLVDRNDPNKGPQIWVMPYKKVAQVILTASFNRTTGLPIFVDDPIEGRDILFNKSGSKMKTQYESVRKDDDPSPLHNDEAVMEKWLNHVTEHSIKKILSFKPYDHIKSVFFGTATEEVVDDAPIVSSSTKRKEREDVTVEVEDTRSSIPVGPGLSLATLNAMEREALETLIADRNMDVLPSDWADTDDLRQAMSLELNLSE